MRDNNQTFLSFLLPLLLASLQLPYTFLFGTVPAILITLNTPPSIQSLIYLAGPVTGLFGQPVMGKLSDGGKRMGWVILATLTACLCVTGLYIIGLIFKDTKQVHLWIISAVLVWILDFSLQMHHCNSRCLIVENLNDQVNANAQVGRLVSIINFAGYLLGPWVKIQFGAIWLGMIGITALCWLYVNEQDEKLNELEETQTDDVNPYTALSLNDQMVPMSNEHPLSVRPYLRVWHEMGPLKKICFVELFIWFGWFLALFYTRQWVGHWGLIMTSGMSFLVVLLGPWFIKKWENPLLKAWFISIIFFAICCIGMSFGSFESIWRIAMAAGLGIAWGCVTWIPYALIGENVYDGLENHVGVVLGLHNVFICLPQMGASLICSITFALLGEENGLRAVWTLFGIFSLGGLGVLNSLKNEKILK